MYNKLKKLVEANYENDTAIRKPYQELSTIIMNELYRIKTYERALTFEASNGETCKYYQASVLKGNIMRIANYDCKSGDEKFIDVLNKLSEIRFRLLPVDEKKDEGVSGSINGLLKQDGSNSGSLIYVNIKVCCGDDESIQVLSELFDKYVYNHRVELVSVLVHELIHLRNEVLGNVDSTLTQQRQNVLNGVKVDMYKDHKAYLSNPFEFDSWMQGVFAELDKRPINDKNSRIYYRNALDMSSFGTFIETAKIGNTFLNNYLDNADETYYKKALNRLYQYYVGRVGTSK